MGSARCSNTPGLASFAPANGNRTRPTWRPKHGGRSFWQKDCHTRQTAHQRQKVPSSAAASFHGLVGVGELYHPEVGPFSGRLVGGDEGDGSGSHPVGELGTGYGFGEVVTLGGVATQVSQHVEGALILDALRDDGQVEVAAQLDDGADDAWSRSGWMPAKR